VVVIALVFSWGAQLHGLAIAGLLIAQAVLMGSFVRSPSDRALYYSGFGVPIYVSGMMVSAFALRVSA